MIEECPTPQKIRYTQKRKAGRAAGSASWKFGGLWHSYKCRCGYWHINRWGRYPK